MYRVRFIDRFIVTVIWRQTLSLFTFSENAENTIGKTKHSENTQNRNQTQEETR